jgi:hypothetical protein
MFFTIEGGQLVLNKEEIRNISEFKAILDRDKGSDGDHDGRKKYKAFKEFYYIWWLCDVKSPGTRAGYNDKELHIQGIKEARLDNDYKPDKIIKDAISYYRENQNEMLVSSSAVTSLIKGIRLSSKIVQRIIASMEKVLEIEIGEDEEREKLIAEGQIPAPIDLVAMAGRTHALLAQYDQLTAIASKTPKLLSTLEELETKLKSEITGNNTVRGGHKKGNRTDPK